VSNRVTVRTTTIEVHVEEIRPGEWMATLFAPEGVEYVARAHDSASAAWKLADQFSARSKARFDERSARSGESPR
jgi:hypothetical protein